MPTHDELDSFLHDWSRLTPEQQERFILSLRKIVHDLRTGSGFRPGLRVKGVRGHPGVFEMTWADDGRATFAYGTSPHAGDVHIVWRRIGTHDILQNP